MKTGISSSNYGYYSLYILVILSPPLGAKLEFDFATTRSSLGRILLWTAFIFSSFRLIAIWLWMKECLYNSTHEDLIELICLSGSQVDTSHAAPT